MYYSSASCNTSPPPYPKIKAALLSASISIPVILLPSYVTVWVGLHALKRDMLKS